MRTDLVPPAPSDRLDGRICLVTGATSGLGAATARALARLGATVIVAGRDAGRCAREVSVTVNAVDPGTVATDLGSDDGWLRVKARNLLRARTTPPRRRPCGKRARP